jgi:hypothetical protein
MAFRIARDYPLTHSSASRPPVHMIKLTATQEITPYPKNYSDGLCQIKVTARTSCEGK